MFGLSSTPLSPYAAINKTSMGRSPTVIMPQRFIKAASNITTSGSSRAKSRSISRRSISIVKWYFLCKYTCMLVSEKTTCISAYSFRGCSRPRFESYTGSESSFTSLSTRKSLNLVNDKTRFSGSTCRFSVALVTKKHKYFPGICDAAGGKAATPPNPGLCFQRKSMFLYSLKIRC